MFKRAVGRELSKLIEGEAPFWENSKAVVLEGPDGPKTFSGLAVAELERLWEVVYGVAGDEAIYRFTADGVPDQRIELEWPEAARKP